MKHLVKFCLLLAVAVSMYACKKTPEVTHVYPIGSIVTLNYPVNDASLATIHKKPLENPIRIDKMEGARPYQPNIYTVTDRIGQIWTGVNDDYVTPYKGAVDTSWFKPN